MQHLVIGRKSHAIGDAVDQIAVYNPDKGTLVLRAQGQNIDPHDQLDKLKSQGKAKGDEIDGNHISW